MGAFWHIILKFITTAAQSIGAFFSGISWIITGVSDVFSSLSGPLSLLPIVAGLGLTFIVARIIVHLL